MHSNVLYKLVYVVRRAVSVLGELCGTTSRLIGAHTAIKGRQKFICLLLIILLTSLSLLWVPFNHTDGIATTCLTCDYKQPKNSSRNKPRSSSGNMRRSNSATASTPLVIHLDFKGAPPTLSYLKKFLPFARSLGATSLLIEYEDTFPFEGRLKVLRSPIFAYTRTEIDSLNSLATSLELDVIPLVQTFGHLEFVLKHEQFSNLREEENNDWSICPLRLQSVSLLHDMINQVLDLHPNSRYMHIGADEVFNLGRCARCKLAVEKHGRKKLYVDHVVAVADYIKEKWPHIRPIFWDDMVRKWPVEDLKVLAPHADPMVWCYTDSIAWSVTVSDLSKLLTAFPGVWIASSFKGSAKSDTNYVPLRHHVANHKSWLEAMRKVNGLSSFRGFVLTGWSRFNHHEKLCELLPAGMPSLAICLAMVDKGALTPALLADVSAKLGYNTPIRLEDLPKERQSDNHLANPFPGYEVFEIIEELTVVNQSLPVIVSMNVAEERTAAVRKFRSKILLLMQRAQRAFPEVYAESIVQEWLSTKIQPLVNWADRRVSNSEAV